MTEKELIARRLAGGPGSGYKDLARVSGIPESRVWRMLKGKVPGVRSKEARRDDVTPKTPRGRIRHGAAPKGALAGLGAPPATGPTSARAVAVAGRVHPFTKALYGLIGRSALMTEDEFDTEKAALKERFQVGAAGSAAAIADFDYLKAIEGRDAALDEGYHALPKPRPPLQAWLVERGYNPDRLRSEGRYAR